MSAQDTDPPVTVSKPKTTDLTGSAYFTVNSSAPIHEVGITIHAVNPSDAAEYYTLHGESEWFSPHGSGISTANVSINQADPNLENTDIPGAEITVRVAHSPETGSTVEIFQTFTFSGRERTLDQPEWPNPGPVGNLRRGYVDENTISIRWVPPSTTGNSLIKYYEMRYNKNSAGFGNWFSTGLAFRVNLSGTSTDSLDVQVRAVNRDGLAGRYAGIRIRHRASDVVYEEPRPQQGQADALPSVSSEERARIAGALAMDRVIFNELRNATTDAHDWIELRNVTNADVTLDGWEVRIIADAGTGIVTLPPGTVLPAGGLLLLVNTPTRTHRRCLYRCQKEPWSPWLMRV